MPYRLDEGYHIVERVFSGGDMRDVLRHLSSASLDRTRAGARHVLRVPVVKELAGDARMLALARQYVGDGAVPFRATLFDKSPEANWLVVWHQDTALPIQRRVQAEEWGPWSMKSGVLYAHAPAWALEQVIALRVSLDDSSRDNGPLRVLPNTHTHGVLSDDEIEILARERPPVECVAASGGVVAMRPLTVHASSKVTTSEPRRVLHIEYAAAMALSSDIELAIA